jgi:gamma-glutamylaminecyclotransferase
MGEALTAPNCTLIKLGGFPGLLFGGDTAVKGEVYEVSDSEDLRRLDGLEGHPNWYRRTPITVFIDGNPVVVDTYIYLAARGSEPKIVSGEWAREGVLA